MDRNTAITEMTDAQIVLLARQDQEAFGVLYQRHSGYLYRYVRQEIGNDADAQDIVSIAFLQALSNLEKLLNPESFRPWLFRIAASRVMDHRRTFAKLAHLTEQSDALPDQVDIEQIAITNDVRAHLAECIKGLSDEQRTIIRLYLAEMDAPSIALSIGMSQEAVRMRRVRAVKRLRSCFGEAHA